MTRKYLAYTIATLTALNCSASNYPIPAIGNIHANEPDTSITKFKFGLSVELYGHNYFGFSDYSQKRSAYSVNLFVRQEIKSNRLCLMGSVGWGGFKSLGFVNYVPIELDIEVGSSPHFLSLGYSQSFAFGRDYRHYYGGRNGDIYPQYDYGIEFVPRVGYSFLKKHFYARVGITPHLYPKKYKTQYDGYSLVRPKWLWFGATLGFVL